MRLIPPVSEPIARMLACLPGLRKFCSHGILVRNARDPSGLIGGIDDCVVDPGPAGSSSNDRFRWCPEPESNRILISTTCMAPGSVWRRSAPVFRTVNACVSCQLIKVDLERFGYPEQDIDRTCALAGFELGNVRLGLANPIR